MRVVPYLISALIGVLVMDYYPQTLWYFLFILLIPLLNDSDTHPVDFSNKKSVFGALSLMFLFGFIFAIGSTLWFVDTYPLDWIRIYDPRVCLIIIGGMWTLFGIAMALPIAPWILLVRFSKNKDPLFIAIWGASCWVLLEYARSWFVAVAVYGTETLFGPHHTYYSLAYPLSSAPFLKELLPMGGIYLTSFVVILGNYLLYFFLRIYVLRNMKGVLSSLYPLLFFIGSIIFVSIYTLGEIRNKNEVSALSPFEAVVITTHVPPGTKDISVTEKEHVAFNAVNSVQNKNAVILLPENLNALTPYRNKEGFPYASIYQDHVIIGSFSGEKLATMFFLDPKTGKTEYTSKRLLMPIGEYSITWVEFLLRKTQSSDWIKNYEKSLHSSNKQTRPLIFKDPQRDDIRVAGTLCAENISPYLYRDAANLGATVFVSLASHAPFHGSPFLLRQTIAINTTRALESGRYFITASNYTPSFVISDTGILKYTSHSKEIFSSFTTKIYPKTYMTPYARFGDYMLILCGIFVALAIIWGVKKDSPSLE